MAKSARSSSKKAVRAQRRDKLKASWQDEADKRRFEALAKAAGAAPVVLPVRAPKDAEMVEDSGRGREGAPAKAARKAAKVPSAVEDDGDEMETGDVTKPKSSKRGRKGVVVRGVSKPTHNKKKASALWVSNFHKSKKGKKGMC